MIKLFFRGSWFDLDFQIERATSPTRTFPGEGLPPGRHPGPTRPPNRLTDLSRPIELSDRAKNAIEGTVFDRPPSDLQFIDHGVIPTSVESPIRSVTPFVHIGDGGPGPIGGGSSLGLPAVHNQPPVQLSSVPFTNIQPQALPDLPPPTNQFPGEVSDTFVNLGGPISGFSDTLPSRGVGGRPFIDLGTGPAPLSHNSPGVGFDSFSGPPVVRGSRSLSLSQGPHHSFALHHPSSWFYLVKLFRKSHSNKSFYPSILNYSSALSCKIIICPFSPFCVNISTWKDWLQIQTKPDPCDCAFTVKLIYLWQIMQYYLCILFIYSGPTIKFSKNSILQ